MHRQGELYFRIGIIRRAKYCNRLLGALMYAISFDLDTEQLKQQYPNDSWQNAYDDIRKELMPLGFTWQQGSVYFGDENMNAVKCVLAAQVLSKAYPWFKSSVRDIRMLRIEDINDLSPALKIKVSKLLYAQRFNLSSPYFRYRRRRSDRLCPSFPAREWRAARQRAARHSAVARTAAGAVCSQMGGDGAGRRCIGAFARYRCDR